MGATVLKQTYRRHAKLSFTQTDLLRFLNFFAVFNAISLNIDELKALNTAKI